MASTSATRHERSPRAGVHGPRLPLPLPLPISEGGYTWAPADLYPYPYPSPRAGVHGPRLTMAQTLALALALPLPLPSTLALTLAQTLTLTLTLTRYMGPGNRADWAVSCPAGTHTLSTGARRRRLQGGGGGGGGGGGNMQGGGPGNAQLTQTLATLAVVDNGDAQTPLPAGSWSAIPVLTRSPHAMEGIRPAGYP
jgi:hypothetical protein